MRAILWAAVSSKPQLEGDSLDKQIVDGEALCLSLDPPARLVATLTVPGHSRNYVRFDHAVRDMSAYAELESLCEKRAFDVLICRSVDRLGRTAALVATVTAIVVEADARVFELENPTPLTQERSDADLYIGAFRQAQAEADVRRLQRHREYGMRARIRKGLAPGKPPYGYRLVGSGRDSHAEIVPAEAATVRRIVAFYLRGWGSERIAATLNAEGIAAARGAVWDASAVRRLLARPFYAGQVTWARARRNGEEIMAKGQHEPLIDDATWLELQREHERRRALHSRGQSSPRLFSGVAYCAECQANGMLAPMRSGGGRTDDPRHPPAYRCEGPRRSMKSHNQVQESHLLARAREVLAALRTSDGLAAALEEVQARQAAPPQAELDALAVELAAVSEERKRLDVAYVRGKALTVEQYEEMAGEIETRRARLTARLAMLQAQRAVREDVTAVEARLRALAGLDLGCADPQEARSLLARCVRIWVMEHRVERIEFV